MLKWKRFLTVLSVVGLVAVMLLAPYSINTKNVMAQVDSPNSGKSVMFFANDEASTAFQNLLANKDEALVPIQQTLKNGNLNVSTLALTEAKQISNLEKVDGLAFPINEVRSNDSLQKSLQQMLKNGEKIYLYGENVTFNEYKTLLGLSDVTVDVLGDSGESMQFSFLEDSVNNEKGKLKENPHSLAEKNEDAKQVIGYSLDNTAVNKVFSATINSEGPNGNLKLRLEDYLQVILDDQIRTAEIEESYQSDKNASMGLFQENAALAGLTLRKDSYDHIAYAKYNYTTFGKVYTDWKLYQQTSESVSGYDYFVVKEYMQPYTYNGSFIEDVKVDHDIPYDSDEIGEWGPSDSGGPTYSVSLSWPFSISYSFSMSSGPNVNEIGSQYYDYARWTMSTYSSGERFIPSTGWKSSGTYASMDIRDYVYFHVPGSQGSTTRAYQKIDVNYDY
ncbi:hypothetical protein [Ornithinibacillus californiensis]|uniref:hypothetical protein n=1 Tax=Ornithinibacillus californiensis TaxID=161536 RepID=UPI00064E1448|nr:hypothetical protein [Ornithinibacillus californiensis]